MAVIDNVTNEWFCWQQESDL